MRGGRSGYSVPTVNSWSPSSFAMTAAEAAAVVEWPVGVACRGGREGRSRGCDELGNTARDAGMSQPHSGMQALVLPSVHRQPRGSPLGCSGCDGVLSSGVQEGSTNALVSSLPSPCLRLAARTGGREQQRCVSAVHQQLQRDRAPHLGPKAGTPSGSRRAGEERPLFPRNVSAEAQQLRAHRMAVMGRQVGSSYLYESAGA